MIPFILAIGCVFLFCIGVGLASWAGIVMQDKGIDIQNIIMFLVGIGTSIFACFCIGKSSDYCYEKESPKTEITTSIPAQVDTIITIRNSIPDTLYVYHLIEEK